MIDDVLVRGGGAAALVRAIASKKSSDMTMAANGIVPTTTNASSAVARKPKPVARPISEKRIDGAAQRIAPQSAASR